MKGWGILAALIGAMAASKSSGTTQTSTGPSPGAQPLNQTPAPAAPPTEVFGIKPGIDVHFAVSDPVQNYATATGSNTAKVEPVKIPDPPVKNSIDAPQPIRNASTGWRWFTPQGPITSREPTPEEKDSGIGCPEIPGIWDSSRNSPALWKYCQNPNCPSNKEQIEPDGIVLPPTPAVLFQEVDNAGNVTYFCQVCFQRTT